MVADNMVKFKIDPNLMVYKVASIIDLLWDRL